MKETGQKETTPDDHSKGATGSMADVSWRQMSPEISGTAVVSYTFFL
jgi:hypothetical protein